MTHWGWYWKVKKKHISRKLCSKLVRIDSFTLYKTTTVFTVYPVEVKAELMADHLKVTYRNRKETSYTIPIDKLTCHYGGYRYFFKCPLCQIRMRFLYFAEQSIFLCRKCLNLSYETQCLRPTERYMYTSEKIKGIIKNKGGDLSMYKKPPRMHNVTYQRLKSKQFYYENKSHQALGNELREWYGAKIEPYLDPFFDYVDEGKEWRKR